ncbi:lamin tail domain-containing protein [Actinoplanes sp. NEAU-A12]|uniref:Lamin tail domain-containing protein n=1 Tax=Actinoplanes sandaracinus TaxID=3045177 RepID=A0ABT6WKS1_9ACTN|nr:lamin tail domain-containing protein [Actinoplanes sandaracinus]MDI6100326.1 lamin tail domain-containing protein [Actinoplanes sandaracinus]
MIRYHLLDKEIASMRRTSPGIVTALATTGVTLMVAVPAGAAEPTPRFLDTQYDSPGSDTRTNDSLNAEWISLVNDGASAVNLSGWKIVDASRAYTFGNVTIAGRGGKVRLHTGKGTNSSTDLYWGSGNYVWNNTGDTATLLTRTGRIHDTCTWTQRSGRATVAC